MASYQPDVILALGGGSPMDAAKIMWVMYEHPETHFEELAMRFMDIRKRIYKFPKMGKKLSLYVSLQLQVLVQKLLHSRLLLTTRLVRNTH